MVNLIPNGSEWTLQVPVFLRWARDIGFILRNLMTIAIGILLCGCTILEPNVDPMLGTWENITNGDRVALNLRKHGICELLIERAFKKPTSRDCKYQPTHDRFFVFLIKADGLCGYDADFEFTFDSEAPLVNFYVNYSPIVMHKSAK